MEITHQKRFEIQAAGVFDKVNTYGEMDKAIEAYGCSCGTKGTELYNQAVGAAFEIYTQFFSLKYGSDPLLGINNILDTSLDPFNAGFDFTFTSCDKKPGQLQSKWKSNPTHQFTMSELGTFFTRLYTHKIIKNNAILFTNLVHDHPEHSIFYWGWAEEGNNAIRVIDKIAQEQKILRNKDFWEELRSTLKSSCREEFEDPPLNEEHQDEMETASNRVIDGELQGGRIICATGGGKTLVEYHNVQRTLFKHKGKLTIVVAPTCDLVNQHFSTFYKWQFFHEHSGVQVVAINFHTGSEPRYNNQKVEFHRTTNGTEVISIIQTAQKVHIITTYASIAALLKVLAENGIIPDLIIFDEFQHVVSQQITDLGVSDMREFLRGLTAERILFYSASQKRGRILSSFDESIYGPLLCNITYRRLRENGILVPKLHIVPIRIQPSRIKGLEADIKEQAKYFEDVDIREVLIEAAGMIVAYEHAASKHQQCNMITWGKKVSHLQLIHKSNVVKERLIKAGLPEDKFHIIHAGIPAAERHEIYNKIRATSHNILKQHSCASEGIDIQNLNIGYVARRLGIISLQQGPGGRITRASREDRKLFKEHKLSINDPTGWKKYSATVYVLIEETQDETFFSILKDIIYKLQYAGLTEDDYEFNDISEERIGDTEVNNDWMTEIEVNVGIKQESLEDIIRQARLELEEEEARIIETARESSAHEIAVADVVLTENDIAQLESPPEMDF